MLLSTSSNVIRQLPDAIVIMLCGFDIERAWREVPALVSRPEWQQLSVVRSGQVVMTDGKPLPQPARTATGEIGRDPGRVSASGCFGFGHRVAGEILGGVGPLIRAAPEMASRQRVAICRGSDYYRFHERPLRQVASRVARDALQGSASSQRQPVVPGAGTDRERATRQERCVAAELRGSCR